MNGQRGNTSCDLRVLSWKKNISDSAWCNQFVYKYEKIRLDKSAVGSLPEISKKIWLKKSTKIKSATCFRFSRKHGNIIFDHLGRGGKFHITSHSSRFKCERSITMLQNYSEPLCFRCALFGHMMIDVRLLVALAVELVQNICTFSFTILPIVCCRRLSSVRLFGHTGASRTKQRRDHPQRYTARPHSLDAFWFIFFVLLFLHRRLIEQHLIQYGDSLHWRQISLV